MADYKDIITGTFKTIVDKVKDVADSNAVRDIYEHGAERTKAYASIAKLTLESNGDAEELKRVYTEIGKLYYEQARDSADGVFASLFSQAEEISARIQEREAKISELKEQCAADKSDGIDIDITVDIDEDFDNVVDSTEADGTGESAENKGE